MVGLSERGRARLHCPGAHATCCTCLHLSCLNPPNPKPCLSIPSLPLLPVQSPPVLLPYPSTQLSSPLDSPLSRFCTRLHIRRTNASPLPHFCHCPVADYLKLWARRCRATGSAEEISLRTSCFQREIDSACSFMLTPLSPPASPCAQTPAKHSRRSSSSHSTSTVTTAPETAVRAREANRCECPAAEGAIRR